MNDAPLVRWTLATSDSGTWIVVLLPSVAGAPIVMRRIASIESRCSYFSRTMIGKWRSVPASYRSAVELPPIAAATVWFTSSGVRP